MVTALHRKLLRELRLIAGPTTAISLVIACAIASLLAMQSTHQVLTKSRDAFYLSTGFSDVFAQVKRAPISVASELAAIPGVAQVDTRTTQSVRVAIDGFDESIAGLLISLPSDNVHQLNRIVLLRGALPPADNDQQIVVHKAFATAHQLEPGSLLTLVINGRRREMQVAGIGVSANHLYAVAPGTALPDDKRFGLFWANNSLVAAAGGLEGATNDLALALDQHADSREVVRAVEDVLSPYGLFAAYDRSLHFSDRNLQTELDQLRSFGLITPGIFLGVAAYLLNVVFGRIVATQRETIAALKALGYRSREIAVHYFQLVAIVVSIGALIGIGAGNFLGRGYVELYRQFFHFPQIAYEMGYVTPITAWLVSLAAGLTGAGGSIARAVRIPPAEAMRPPAPPAYRRGTVEKTLTLVFGLGPSGKMALRNLLRKPIQSLLAVVGLGFAVSTLILGTFSKDSVDHLLHLQYHVMQREDIAVQFLAPVRPQVVAELTSIDGVELAEGTRDVPAVLGSGRKTFRLGLTGLEPDATLRRSLDKDLQQVVPPRHGLAISRQLAKILAVKPGQHLTIEVLEGKRPTLELPVLALIDDYLGVQAIIANSTLAAELDQDVSYSSAYLRVRADAIRDVQKVLEDRPGVLSVTRKNAAIENFERQVADMQGVTRAIISLFAACIAFGVVYNAARVSLAEYSRDFGTLRVLGLTSFEVWMILVTQFSIILLAALPLGCAIGYSMALGIAESATSDLFRFPLVVEPKTYAMACLEVLAAALLTAQIVRRKIGGLDLVEVLKTRD